MNIRNTGPYFNDMYFLDVEILTWIKIELNSDENFFTRGRHCSCIVDNEIIIFGGKNDNFLVKTDLLIGNLDVGESTKIIRAGEIMKNKKIKKGKNDNELINFEQEYNSNNASDKPDINTNNEEDENENIILDSKRRVSLSSSNKEKMFDINPTNKFKKEAKIIMNQKVQTSKNFFLDFPKQKKELQEKFKEIDAINFSSSDNQKIQDIIKNTFKEYNIN